jgi:putative ABC transport system permease protein
MTRFRRLDFRRLMGSSLLVSGILGLGLFGLALSAVLRTSVQSFLDVNARLLLTADISLTSYSRLVASDLEAVDRHWRTTDETREIEFVTMAGVVEASPQSADGRKQNSPDPNTPSPRGQLVEVHAVASNFPLVGEFVTTSGRRPKADISEASLWLSRDAEMALQVKPGDRIRLGRSEFRVESILEQSPGFSRAGFGFAPRVYIREAEAEGTGLLDFGAQVYHRVFRNLERLDDRPLPASVSPQSPLNEQVQNLLSNPDIFVRTPGDSGRGLERGTRSVTLFLSLISSLLLGLSGAAAFAIFRAQSFERLRTAGIASVFGAATRSHVSAEFLRVSFVVLVACVGAQAASYLTARIAEPSLQQLIARSTAGEFRLLWPWQDFAVLALATWLGALAFLLPFQQRFRNARLADLLADTVTRSDAADAREPGARRMQLAALGLGLSALGLLSAWLLESAMRGMWVALGLLALLGIGDLLGRGAFAVLGRALRWTGSGWWRLLGLQLTRARFAVRLAFLAIVLCSFAISLVGQSVQALQGDLRELRADRVPDFFLFNIPESELPVLSDFAKERGTALDFVSPMILARLEAKNGVAFTDERFARFPVRVTWREKLIDSESLVQGQALPPRYEESQGRPKLSVEVEFAERSDFKIGDVLKFDVQGVVMEAEIANLRRVKWTDFNPNFFISFQAGVLEDAPKTWLANLQVPDAQRGQWQGELIRRFPDISVIDVGQTLGRIAQMLGALLGPAGLSAALAVGFATLILLALIWFSAHSRQAELQLFRVLGADPVRVRWLLTAELATASLGGALLGASLGALASWWVSVAWFELAWSLDLKLCLILIGAAAAMGGALGRIMSWRAERGLGNARRLV